MDSINSWIDEDEVSKLAEELTKAQKVVAQLKEDSDQLIKDVAEAKSSEVVKLAKETEPTRLASDKLAEDFKPEVVEIDGMKPDVAKPDVAKPDLVKIDLVKPADEVKADEIKPDEVKIDLVKPDEVKTDEVQAEKSLAPVKIAKPTEIVKPSNTSIGEILKEQKNSLPGSVRIPNEMRAEKALKPVSSEDLIIPKEIKEEKVLALAKASEMAASVGLIKDKIAPKVSEVTSLCDTFLDAVPVNIDTREEPVPVPTVHSEKGIGTFEKIDKELSSMISANGICVIDRDGDVLYSSLKNNKLITFTIDTMMESKLMHTKAGEVGNIRLKLSSNHFIEFVAVNSTRGVIILTAVLKDSLGRQKAKEVGDQILKIANEV